MIFDKDGNIVNFPLAEISLTPLPASCDDIKVMKVVNTKVSKRDKQSKKKK